MKKLIMPLTAIVIAAVASFDSTANPVEKIITKSNLKGSIAECYRNAEVNQVASGAYTLDIPLGVRQSTGATTTFRVIYDSEFFLSAAHERENGKNYSYYNPMFQMRDIQLMRSMACKYQAKLAAK